MYATSRKGTCWGFLNQFSQALRFLLPENPFILCNGSPAVVCINVNVSFQGEQTVM